MLRCTLRPTVAISVCPTLTRGTSSATPRRTTAPGRSWRTRLAVRGVGSSTCVDVKIRPADRALSSRCASLVVYSSTRAVRICGNTAGYRSLARRRTRGAGGPSRFANVIGGTSRANARGSTSSGRRISPLLFRRRASPRIGSLVGAGADAKGRNVRQRQCRLESRFAPRSNARVRRRRFEIGCSQSRVELLHPSRAFRPKGET